LFSLSKTSADERETLAIIRAAFGHTRTTLMAWREIVKFFTKCLHAKKWLANIVVASAGRRMQKAPAFPKIDAEKFCYRTNSR
jgi:hypothetical protein